MLRDRAGAPRPAAGGAGGGGGGESAIISLGDILGILTFRVCFGDFFFGGDGFFLECFLNRFRRFLNAFLRLVVLIVFASFLIIGLLASEGILGEEDFFDIFNFFNNSSTSYVFTVSLSLELSLMLSLLKSCSNSSMEVDSIFFFRRWFFSGC